MKGRQQPTISTVFLFADSPHTDMAQRHCASPEERARVLSLFPSLSLPCRVLFLSSAPPLACSLLWALWAVWFAVNAFVNAEEAAAITVHIRGVAIDVMALSNVFLCIVAPAVFRRLLDSGVLTILLHASHNRNAPHTRRLVARFSYIALSLIITFISMTVFGVAHKWERLSQKERVFAYASMTLAMAPYICMLSVLLALWSLCLSLLEVLVDDIRDMLQEFPTAPGYRMEAMPQGDPATAQQPLLTAAVPRTTNDALEETIRCHTSATRLCTVLSSTFQPFLLLKIAMDFSILLTGVAQSVQDTDAAYAGVVVVVVSLVIAGVVLLPASYTTSQMQGLLHDAVSMRAFCIGAREKSELESLVRYLTPYYLAGGIRFLGVLVTPAITMRTAAVMWSLFLAANLL